jgi:ribosome maturation factor RimP
MCWKSSPLRRAADYERFAGQEVSVTLKLPFQGRKVWQGLLVQGEGEGWSLVFKDAKDDKAEQVLAFTLDEVREARLVPVVDFKGRRSQKAGAAPTSPAGANRDVGGQER